MQARQAAGKKEGKHREWESTTQHSKLPGARKGGAGSRCRAPNTEPPGANPSNSQGDRYPIRLTSTSPTTLNPSTLNPSTHQTISHWHPCMSVLTHPGSPTHPAHQSVRQSVGQSARQEARPGSHSASRSVSVIVLQHGSATASVSMAEPRALRVICLYQLRHPQSSLRHCRSAARRRP